MTPYQTNDYAAWRRHSISLASIHEPGTGTENPPESLLQGIWFHQRLKRDGLRTTDGREVKILHPGFWNRESGPDFHSAVVQFGSETPQEGDIEIDMEPGDWRTHGHAANPAFAKVVLHVVWRGSGAERLPTLVLEPLLDAPLAELAWWHGGEGGRAFPAELAGRCCAPLRELSEERLLELLRQAAAIRMQSKAAQFHARARQAGWEQALWEGLFRGLGYKRNLWPMLRLAELRGRICPDMSGLGGQAIQGRLLGIGGLLPEELTRRRGTTDSYVRGLWDGWWRERDAFVDCVLPRSLWNFAGLRPANHPERRLALAAHWLADGKLPSRLESWCSTTLEPKALVASLLKAMQAPKDGFWSHHWTLRSKSFAAAQPLLGATRVTDLAINVVLPWLWVRAVEGKNDSLRREMERRFFAWPAAEDNAVLRLARQRLLGAPKPKLFQTAAAQQGLMQVVRDFCEHSNALCDECRFPELVKGWAAGRPAD